MSLDPFAAQARLDRFRRALAEYASKLDNGPHIEAALERAESHGWDVEVLAEAIRQSMPVGAGPGLVVAKLQSLAAGPRVIVTEHQARAMDRGRFHQPKPPCGRCDSSPARWLDVTPKEHKGQTVVTHCPACWVAPPGYLMPSERRRVNRERAGGAY